MKPTFLVFLLASVATTISAQQIPDKRAHHELVYDESSKTILMTAGSTPLDGGQSFRFYNDLWRYDGKSWTKIGNAGDERSGIRLAYNSKDKKIYSYGGFTGESRAELRVLEGTDWKILSNDPQMKAAEPGLVYDSKRDRLVAFGGSGEGGMSGATWEWDGSRWEKINIEGPAPRQGFVMVFDSKRNKTVLYGGSGGGPDKSYSDTWEYDGKTWTKVSDSGPETRVAAGSTFDSKRGLTIVFGGFNKAGVLGDMWAWDGKEWKKLTYQGGPTKRGMGYMAYDKARDKVVLFGGRLGWPNDANDTWEWDGKDWKQIL